MMKKTAQRIVSIVCSAALVSALFVGTGTTAAAASSQSTIETVKTEVLFESGYDTANTKADKNSKVFATPVSDMYPDFDPDDPGNVVMQCIKHTANYSYLYLGADYATDKNAVSDQSITVAAGDVYDITFKYQLTKGSTDAVAGFFDVGICTVTSNLKDTELDNWNNNQHYSNAVTVVTKDTAAVTDGWVTYHTTYTVPEIKSTAASDPMSKLALYCKVANNQYTVYFDDVKVSRTVKTTVELLTDEDFSGATVREDPWSTAATLGGAWPVTDESGNIVIQHSPNFWGQGVIPIGAPMTSNSANQEAVIRAEAGATYHIEFDYRLTGTNSTAAYEIGFGVGPETGHNTDQGPTFSFKRTILSFDKSTAFDGTWKRASADITVPADTDFANGDKLMLYFSNGHGSTYYFDNLYVYKVTGITYVIGEDKVVAENDYSTANTSLDEWSTTNSSLNVVPAVDPLNPDNKAVKYKQAVFAQGAVYLGALFDKNQRNIIDQALSAEAGRSYSVKFDYYIVNAPMYDLNVYLTVGNTKVDAETFTKNTITYDTDNAINVLSFAAETDPGVSGWITTEAIITIPDNCDFANGNKLMLYVQGGGNGIVDGYQSYVELYFDNVTVTELAPVGVRFVVNGKSDYKVFPGNHITYNAPAGKAMLWYTDAEMIQPFSPHFYDNGGKLANITVYGREVESDTPLIIGDVNNDGEFTAVDLTTLRRVLLDAEEVVSEYRTDTNTDGQIDIRDLVRIKNRMAAAPEAYTINGNSISDYTIVYSAATQPEMVALINSVAQLAGTQTAVDTTNAQEYEIIIGNANRNGVITGLAADEYIIKSEGNKLYVNGGSERALIAAIKSLIGHINTGKNIDDTYFIDFEYSGGDFPATLVLAFEEEFSVDFTGAINNPNNPATANYRNNWGQSYFTDLSNTTTSASNGFLTLTGSKVSDADGNITYWGGEVFTTNYYSYGYYEIRAKVNSSTGICPAFWLIGDRNSNSKIEYEIDVFECFGNYPQYVKGTLLAHNYPNGFTSSGDEKESTEHRFIYEQLTELTDRGQTYSYNENGWGDEFHTFGLDWRYDSITWYIDGVAVLRAKPSLAVDGHYIFNEPLRVKLTCYAGRNVAQLTGMPDDTTDWENGNSLVVDYLRIYQYSYA